MAIDYGQRFVTKGGSSSGDGLTIETSFLTVQQAAASMNTESSMRHGHVMVGAGSFVETGLPIQFTRTVRVSAIHANPGFGGTGTEIVQGSTGHLIEWEAGQEADQWAHHLQFENITLRGTTNGGSGSDLLRINRPAFSCYCKSVRFEDARRYGLVLQQGANFFHGNDLGFNNCGTGAMWFHSDPASSTGQAFGFAGGDVNSVQIDNCGASPVKIEVVTTGFNSSLSFSNFEFETSSTGLHRKLFEYVGPSGAKSKFDVSHVFVTDSSSASGKRVIDETGSDAAQWGLININNWNNPAFDFLFNGQSGETCAREVLPLGLFQSAETELGSGITFMVLGGVEISSSTSTPTHSGRTGSMHLTKASTSSNLYVNNSTADPGTLWKAMS